MSTRFTKPINAIRKRPGHCMGWQSAVGSLTPWALGKRRSQHDVTNPTPDRLHRPGRSLEDDWTFVCRRRHRNNSCGQVHMITIFSPEFDIALAAADVGCSLSLRLDSCICVSLSRFHFISSHNLWSHVCTRRCSSSPAILTSEIMLRDPWLGSFSLPVLRARLSVRHCFAPAPRLDLTGRMRRLPPLTSLSTPLRFSPASRPLPK